MLGVLEYQSELVWAILPARTYQADEILVEKRCLLYVPQRKGWATSENFQD